MPDGTVLVYRDRIVTRSELHFLRRMYVGFERLTPLWVGRHRGDALPELGAESVFLGRNGPLGTLDREIFKQFGVLPTVPDLRARHPKLVHAHFGRGGALALPMARALGVPLVVTFHGADATKEKQYRRSVPPSVFQRRLSALKEQAALFLCVSAFIRDQLVARGFPPDKLEVHHTGTDIDPVHGRAPGGDDYVLFAGRFVEKKGVPSLLQAMRLLRSGGSALRLVLVGDGPMGGDLRRSAAAIGNVDLPGWLPNHALRHLMRGALALVVPSQRAADGDAEGLPTVVIEAMAAGTPVIGSRHAGITEAIEDGVTGFLVPERAPEALAAAMRRLADEPGLRDRLGGNARLAAEDRFDMVAQSRRLEQRLLAVIAGTK